MLSSILCNILTTYLHTYCTYEVVWSLPLHTITSGVEMAPSHVPAPTY